MTQKFRIEPFWGVILKEFELSGEALARRAGLPSNLFSSDSVWVNVDEWAALWDTLEVELDLPNLALLLGQSVSVDLFDPAIFAAFCSRNLAQTASRLQLYKTLTGPCRLQITEHHEHHEHLGLSCHVSGLPFPPALWGTAELVVWVVLARHMTRHHIVPVSVTAPVLPSNAETYEAFFGVPVSPGNVYEVVFRREDAERIYVVKHGGMWEFFEPVLRNRLAEINQSASMTERVSAALFEVLASGQNQIGDVARELGTSSRTIQRKLGLEGTSFRQVLNQTRATLARHYLTRTSLTTTEVAFLIGFDDPNSLYPAFRSWTGTTPQAIRAAARRAG